MKKKLLLISIFVLSLFGVKSSAQNNWIASNIGLPANSSVNDFASTSNGDIYIVLNSNSQGFLYKSSDNGSTWANVSTNGLPNGAWAHCFFIKSNIMFIGTGNLGAGLYNSTDNGQNWTTSITGLPSNPFVNDFALMNNGDILMTLISNAQGFIYKSSNNGSSWTNIPTLGLPTGAWANTLFIKNNTIFLGTSNMGSGLYSSNDNGQNWTPSNTGLPTNPYVTDFALMSNGDIFTILNSNGQGYLYKSSDNGSSWTNIITTGLPASAWANTLFVQNNTMLIGSNGLGANLYSSSIITEINKIVQTNNVLIFPNPTTGNINITSDKTIGEITIINTLGQIIYKSKPNEKQFYTQIDECGFYFIILNLGNKILVHQVIVNGR